jgi:hypothetical protein
VGALLGREFGGETRGARDEGVGGGDGEVAVEVDHR